MAHTGKIEYKDELGFRDLGPIVKSGGASPIDITCGLRMMTKSEAADAVSTIRLANILGRTKEGEDLLAGAYNRMGKSIASGKLDKSFYETQGHILGVFDALFKALKQTSVGDYEAKDAPNDAPKTKAKPASDDSEKNIKNESGSQSGPEEDAPKANPEPTPKKSKKDGPWSEENQKRIRAMNDDEFDKYSISVGKDYGLDMNHPQNKESLQRDLDPQRFADRYYEEHIRPIREQREREEDERRRVANMGRPDTRSYDETVEDEDDDYSPPQNIIDNARDTTVNMLNSADPHTKAKMVALVNRMLLEQREAEYARQQALNLRNRGARSKMDPLADVPIGEREELGSYPDDPIVQMYDLDEGRSRMGLSPWFGESLYGRDTKSWRDGAHLDPETAAKMAREYGEVSNYPNPNPY